MQRISSVAASESLLSTLARTSVVADYAFLVRPAAVLFVIGLTTAAAQVSIPLPFTPVPFTLQPMVVLLSGAALGARLGALSQMLYLAAGVIGLPVFAFSPILPQGAARLMGPTAGYLLSYPLAAWVTGYLADRGFDRRYVTSIAAMAAGLTVVFAGGLWWLTVNPVARVSFSQALAIGFYPFVLADILKLAAAAAILPALWRIVGRPHS